MTVKVTVPINLRGAETVAGVKRARIVAQRNCVIKRILAKVLLRLVILYCLATTNEYMSNIL